MARLILFFRDAAGNAHWEHPHTACALTGTKRWRRYRWAFAVPSWAVTAHVCVQQAGRSGVMWADDLSLTPVRLNPTFRAWQGAAFAVAAVVSVGYLLGLGLLRRRYGAWVVSLACGIVAGAVCPTGVFAQIADCAVRIARHGAKQGSVTPAPGVLREPAAAGTSEAAVPQLMRDDAEMRARLRTGLKTELLQSATLSRHPFLEDWFLDAGGAALGGALFVGWRHLTERKAA